MRLKKADLENITCTENVHLFTREDLFVIIYFLANWTFSNFLRRLEAKVFASARVNSIKLKIQKKWYFCNSLTFFLLCKILTFGTNALAYHCKIRENILSVL